MFIRVFEIFLPLLAIVLVGYLYARGVKPDLSGASRTAVDIALPALSFTTLASTPVSFASDAAFLGAATLVMAASALLAWIAAKPVGVDPRAFVPTMAFGNVGPVGLPLSLLAFGAEGLKAAVLLMVLANIYHFTAGVQLMSGRADLRALVRNPTIWASVAGLVFSHFQWTLPGWMSVAIRTLGEMLVPVMLLSMGARMTSIPWSSWRMGSVGGAFAPLSRLFPALACVAILPLAPVQQGALIVFASLPSAIINYLLAERFSREPAKVAAIVLIGHLLALAFLPLGLYLALR
jgi:predicted permease